MPLSGRSFKYEFSLLSVSPSGLGRPR